MICPEQKYVDANRSLTSHPKEDDKDLAHHIKQKKQKDPKGPIQTMEGSMDASSYCKEGARNLKRGFVAAALRSYHQSAATEEYWPETFIGRSRCYQLLGMPDNALKDANLAIQYRRTMGQVDPLNHHLPLCSVRFLKLGMEALQAKGQALYDLFQFEQSLISLYQAQTFRPDLASKLNGLISKNINAIHNTLYPNCFHFDGVEKVLNNTRLRAKVQMLRNPLTKCTQQIQIAGHLRRKSVRNANGRLNSATLKKSPEPPMPDLEHLRETLVMTRHPALGDLIRDLRFLEQLSNHKDMSGLEGHVKQTLQYLEQRRQFWENFNPREVRNKSKKMSSSSI
ncbi:hypothetical protein TCAL_02833 [Tigriopus californicus]|uniref:Outer dynein arm-docking complex subunit 4 n=2 Tax=Tigriopus californicus TaxID=6832 RepID=A0A553PN41_TIGCA|nr:hypothetical protein TCAL_02833 [Tigriopus californicus]|eukprot:TCALIF_02833-PA protein Name:"Protein of unknown function" AED:0.00 eAED:0.00 QI:15/1/1/1/1/1/2/75/338